MGRIVPMLDTLFVTVVNMDDVIPKLVTHSCTKLREESFDVPHAWVWLSFLN